MMEELLKIRVWLFIVIGGMDSLGVHMTNNGQHMVMMMTGE